MSNVLLFVGTEDDRSYLFSIKKLIPAGTKVHVSLAPVLVLTQVVISAKQFGTKEVFTTSQKLLHLLLGYEGGVGHTPTINDYAGSMITKMGVDFLIINPLEQLHTVPYGEFLFRRYLSKFTHAEKWLTLPEFRWELFAEENTDNILEHFAGASFIAQDIETRTSSYETGESIIDGSIHVPIITCHSFSAFILRDAGKLLEIRTVVIPYTSTYNIAVAGTLCSLAIPKCFQNGKYDVNYLLRYNQPVHAWAYDTAHMFHCWYSEMPKDLGFLTGFLLRNSQYWKDESKTSDLMEYYAYNAKDSYNTGLCWLALMQEIPEYAINNYIIEFPLVFPCVLAEATGIKWDPIQAKKLEEQVDEQMAGRLSTLRTMVNCEAYNPSSSQQTVKLFGILGSGDIRSSGKIPTDKVKARHPLNDRILSDIGTYRSERKLASSYLKDGVSWNGRVYYALNPHGTDTGRLASKESQFWCGLQIQNIPRDPPSDGDPAIKSAFVSDEGFYFGEADYSQAEAFDTAFISGDVEFIRTITDRSIDFHGANASKFFGIPYNTIMCSTAGSDGLTFTHKTLNKTIRDLSKRTNHGANYNMGAKVMLDTMGIKNVIRARTLLGLPEKWTLLQVTQHLLNVYAKTYPTVKGDYYARIISDVVGSGILVGPTGWTRRCFSNPAKDKRALNSYVAHPSQSLNAQTLNKAWLRIFYEIYLPNPKDFKLHAQIHDSILFSYRKTRIDLAYAVKNAMEFDVPVKDIFGITRDLRVPVDLKGNGTRWSELLPL